MTTSTMVSMTTTPPTPTTPSAMPIPPSSSSTFPPPSNATAPISRHNFLQFPHLSISSTSSTAVNDPPSSTPADGHHPSLNASSNLSSAVSSFGITTRKYSFPLSALSTVSFLGADVGLLSARRRLSNVSDVVSRKLSNTIGWKTPAQPSPEIITQGRCLCGQYVRGRLRRAGVYNKKMGLHRMRSFVGSTAEMAAVVREVYPALSFLGEELERMHQKLYSSVARQVSSRGSGGDIKSTENASFLLSTIARDLFRADITWSKVAALFAIAGGLALDCVRQGHPEFVPKLIESMADVIEDELVVWIAENGGWVGMNVHVRPETSQLSLAESSCLGLACVLGVCVLFYILKFIGFRLIPWAVIMIS